MWARIMKERFGAKEEKSMMLRFHTQTAGVQLTAQQPEVNMVRVAIQALAATLGGTQSLHTNSFDEALALPTEKSARLALRTQQVIAHESDVARTVDPLAGSYLIESMTDEIEREARGLHRADRRDGRSGPRHRGGLPEGRDRTLRLRLRQGGRERASRSSSASTGSSSTSTPTPSCRRSTRPSGRARSIASTPSRPTATRAVSTTPSMPSERPHRATTTCWPRCARR